MTEEEFRRWIKLDEGYDNKPYLCTAGKLTIGWGRNLQDNGISLDEAELMLTNDIRRATDDIKNFQWYIKAPHCVKNALRNMSFNLGLPRLLSFKRMIYALEQGNYTQAAIEALDSKWAQQVGPRAKDIALMIRDGNDESSSRTN